MKSNSPTTTAATTASRTASRRQAMRPAIRVRNVSIPRPASTAPARLARNKERAGTRIDADAGHHRIAQGVQPQPSPTGERHGQARQQHPASHEPPIRTPQDRDHRQNQRHQADREDRLPVVIVAEVIGRAAQGRGAEQLEGVEASQVIPVGDAGIESPGRGSVGARDARTTAAPRPLPPSRSRAPGAPATPRSRRPGDGCPRDRRARTASATAQAVRAMTSSNHSCGCPVRYVSARIGTSRSPRARPSRCCAIGPERPGIPAGRPDVRVMALERVGQEIRRGLIDPRRDGRRPSARSDRPHQHIDAESAPEQMGDGQPSQGRRRSQPPGDPDGGIGHPGLRVAGQWPPAEATRVPRRPVAELARSDRRSTHDGGGTGRPGHCRRAAGRPGWRSRRWVVRRRRSSLSAARPGARSRPRPTPAGWRPSTMARRVVGTRGARSSAPSSR